MSESTRRLPVYLVLDTSGSMGGEPIEALRGGLRLLVDDLQSNPQALETVWLSVITFDSSARQVAPLTEIGAFTLPNLQAAGSTDLAAGLRLLMQSMDQEVRKNTADRKGDWKPLVFLLTDGYPDSGCGWEAAADDLKRKRPANIIACAAGPAADETVLKRITETVVKLQDARAGTLGTYLKWVTASINVASASVGTKGEAAINFQTPPAGIQIIP